MNVRHPLPCATKMPSATTLQIVFVCLTSALVFLATSNWSIQHRCFFLSKPHGLLLLLLRFCFFIIDVNECTASSSMCHENAFCNNTLGSYNCSCKPGYFGDGKTCKGKIGRCLHHSSFQSLIARDVTPRFVSAKLGINPSVT